jgi:hypothetical protein
MVMVVVEWAMILMQVMSMRSHGLFLLLLLLLLPLLAPLQAL